MSTVKLMFSKQATGFLLLLIPAFYLPVKLESGNYRSTPANRSEKPAPITGEFVQKDTSLKYEYRIGSGIAKVTDPAIGLGMQGMADDRQKTKGVEMELYSRAFIIEHAITKKRVILLNADIWSCTHAIKKEVVRQLQASYGSLYTMNNVLISGTHNHSGPGGFSHYYLYNHSMRGFDSYNFSCITSGMVLSISKAHANLAPGRIYIHKGEIADCGRNRSLVAYHNNPADERKKYTSDTDKEMLLLRFMKIKDSTERPIGILNWYGIHPTDRGQKNTKVCGDNKGYASYLFEREMRTNYTAAETFVAAFANASAGDVSGNVEFGAIPDGRRDAERMRMHGKKQYDKARELFYSAGEELKGDIDYRHSFTDMVAKTGAPGALGLSMFAGSTEDSNPGSGLKEGITETGHVGIGERTVQIGIATAFVFASGVPCPTVANLSKAEIDAHLPKPITLAPGVTNPIKGFPAFVPLTPTILPVQLFRIGQLAITGVPAEFTTMSGRRLIESVLIELKSAGVRHVALNTYANSYSGYVTTHQEYQKQHYEGASTLFGPNTLNVYIAEFKELAKAIRNNTTVANGPNPPDLSRQVKKIPRITIRNQSGSRQTLYFYNHNDILMWKEFSKKVIPANSEMVLDLARPNGESIAWPRTKAKVALNKNKKSVPQVSNGKLILINSKGKLSVKNYTPPPR